MSTRCLEMNNMNSLLVVTEDELLEITGGVDWDAVATLATDITIVSAVIAQGFPPAGIVTIVCGAYAAGYHLGQAITG